MKTLAPLLVLAALLPAAAIARGDGGTGVTSVDAWAKERVEEFEELGEKPTLKKRKRRMAILKELERAPCRTSQRFLLGLLKKRSTPGDHRLFALRSLTKIADEKTFEGVLSALGKAKDPTLWTAFGDYLAGDPSGPAQAWRTGPGLDARSSDAVRACCASLAAKPVPATKERLAALYASSAGKEKAVEVAHTALHALTSVLRDAAGPWLLEAAGHPDWRLRLVAAERLPSIEPFEDDVAQAVRTLLQDESATVRQAAAHACGTHKRSTVAEALAGLLGDSRARTRHEAQRALVAIRGEDTGAAKDLTFPSYHGLDVCSDRVVFLVDASSSMTWPWRKETHRIDVAKRELASVLEQLPSETLFNVIVFAEKPIAWKRSEVEASAKHRRAAVKWAAKRMADPEGDTFLYEALEAAYGKNPAFDTIFLLTDGDPTAGRYWSQEGLLASVRAWTRFRRTAIHTIGLSLFLEDVGMPNLAEDRHAMKRLLQAIAKATGGRCKVIERAPKGD